MRWKRWSRCWRRCRMTCRLCLRILMLMCIVKSRSLCLLEKEDRWDGSWMFIELFGELKWGKMVNEMLKVTILTMQLGLIECMHWILIEQSFIYLFGYWVILPTLNWMGAKPFIQLFTRWKLDSLNVNPRINSFPSLIQIPHSFPLLSFSFLLCTQTFRITNPPYYNNPPIHNSFLPFLLNGVG